MRLREKIAQFMVGRRGADELTRFGLLASAVMAAVSLMLLGAWRVVFISLAAAVLLWGYLRMFSRDLAARQRENSWYVRKRLAIWRWLLSLREQWRQREDYQFFRCPTCRLLLRVPRNKGKLLLTCRKCGTRFERHT